MFSNFGMEVPIRRNLNMDHQQNMDFNGSRVFCCRCGELCGDYTWKKKDIKRTLWGVPFPSPENVQNEHFYIILFTRKGWVNVFEFLDGSSNT